MISSYEHRLIEHRVRVARAERLGPHFAEIVPLQHRVRVAGAERLGRRLGAALVAVGARLQGAEPADRSVAARFGPGIGT